MVFIMGPTGAGKSSVLRAIYKDLMISSGKIFRLTTKNHEVDDLIKIQLHVIS